MRPVILNITSGEISGGYRESFTAMPRMVTARTPNMQATVGLRARARAALFSWDECVAGATQEFCRVYTMGSVQRAANIGVQS